MDPSVADLHAILAHVLRRFRELNFIQVSAFSQLLDCCCHAACRTCPFVRLNRSIIPRLNAGISSGLRLDTMLPSVTHSSSTHSAPALRRSVLSDGHEAIRLPRPEPASMTVQGPWQITATGLLASKNAFTNSTAFGSIRSLSGFMTPPGSKSASKLSGLALS